MWLGLAHFCHSVFSGVHKEWNIVSVAQLSREYRREVTCDLTKVCIWYEILVKMWLLCIKVCVWWFPPDLVSLHPHSHCLLFSVQHHFLSVCGHFWWVFIACEDEHILTRIKIQLVWDGSVKPRLYAGLRDDFSSICGLRKRLIPNCCLRMVWVLTQCFAANTEMQSQGAEWMLNMTGSELEELIQLGNQGEINAPLYWKSWTDSETLIVRREFSGTNPVCLLLSPRQRRSWKRPSKPDAVSRGEVVILVILFQFSWATEIALSGASSCVFLTWVGDALIVPLGHFGQSEMSSSMCSRAVVTRI